MDKETLERARAEVNKSDHEKAEEAKVPVIERERARNALWSKLSPMERLKEKKARRDIKAFSKGYEEGWQDAFLGMGLIAAVVALLIWYL